MLVPWGVSDCQWFTCVVTIVRGLVKGITSDCDARTTELASGDNDIACVIEAALVVIELLTCSVLPVGDADSGCGAWSAGIVIELLTYLVLAELAVGDDDRVCAVKSAGFVIELLMCLVLAEIAVGDDDSA